jgi:two-component system, LytTR family, sensor kinase
MIKRILGLFAIATIGMLLFLLPSLFNEVQKQDSRLTAERGSLDAATWDFERNSVLRLDGEWELYWDELLTPEDFEGESPIVPTGYMQVPALWNGKNLYGKQLPAFGCATYRLIIENVPFEGVLGLKKGNARFSSKVFVNGHLLISDGVPAHKAADYQSGNTPKLGFFKSESGRIEILVQVANYEYMNSGIPVSLELGKQDDMLYQHQRNYLLSLAVFIVLLTIAFLFIIFFTVARIRGVTEYLLPLFSLFCFLFAVGNALTDQRPLLLFLPDISFTMVFKMKDFFLSANFIIVIWIFHKYKNTLLTPWLAKIITYIYASYLIAIILLPIHVYYKIHQVVMVCNTVILLILLVRVVLLYIQKAEGLLLFVAILSVNLYSADAILFSLGQRTSSSFTQVYIMIFAIAMMLLLSMQYFTAIGRLQNSIMRAQEAEIAFLRAQINPHFLYNTLNSIAALCREAPDKAEEVVVELSRYLRRSFDFKRLDSMTTLDRELELLDAYLYIEKVRFGERLQMEYDIENGLYLSLPPLILQPLVENAVRHGLMKRAAGGTVSISIRCEGDMVVFTIADNGIGMEHNTLEQLLDENENRKKSEYTKKYKYLKKSESTKKSINTEENKNIERSGIGLWNINRRLKMHYGHGLMISSEIGKGTSVTFSLPLENKIGRL